MSVVLLSLAQPCADCEDGISPASGRVYFAPTLRHTTGVHHTVVLPTPFVVCLTGEETAPVEILLEATPPDGSWVWQVVEKVQNGSRRMVLVPPSADPLDYGELEEVYWSQSAPVAWSVLLNREIIARQEGDAELLLLIRELYQMMGAELSDGGTPVDAGIGTADGGEVVATGTGLLDGGSLSGSVYGSIDGGSPSLVGTGLTDGGVL